jgi:hypothetical protein
MASDPILEQDPGALEFEKRRDFKIRINYEYYPKLVNFATNKNTI